MAKKVIITEKQFKHLFEEEIAVSYNNPLSLDMAFGTVNEGLIKTYPFEKMMEYVGKQFNIPSFYMHAYDNNGVKCIAIDLPKNEEFQKRVDKAMNLCGYFISLRISMDELDRIHYEPKFEGEEEDIGNVLYHITSSSNVDKIRSIGLCPYHKNEFFKYPSRIYFFKGDTSKETLETAAKALDKYLRNKDRKNSYCVLKIDVNKLPDDVKFYVDPNMDGGVYTVSNIPPNCIMDDIIEL